MNCDHCGSDQIRAETANVRPHGKRLVFVCESCGQSWVNTEPQVVEQLIVAAAPVGQRWDAERPAL